MTLLCSLVLAACNSAVTPNAAGKGTGNTQVQQQILQDCPELSGVSTMSGQLLRPPCGDPDLPPLPSDDTVLTPEARVLESNAILSYFPDTGQIVLSSTPETNTYTSGLVVVGGQTSVTPAGIPPRRITGIQNQNGNWVLSTVEASLTDIIEEGTLDFSRSLRADEIALVEGESPCDPDLNYFVACGGSPVEFNNSLSSQSLLHALSVSCSTPGSIFNKSFDKGVLKGCIDLGVKPKVSLKIRRARVESFEASVQLSEQAKLQIELLNQSASLKKDWELGSIWFQPITVSIGPVPVVLTSYVKFIGHMDGSVSATLKYEVTQDATYKGGLQYQNGSMSVINQRSGPVVSTLTGGPVGKADVTASIEARGGIGFYVTVVAAHADGGVYAGIRGYGKASIDTSRHPLWQVTAGPQFCIGYTSHVEVLLGLLNRRWSGESCGSLFTSYEAHSNDVGPVFQTGVSTWNTVSLNFDIAKGSAEILKVTPAGDVRVGYLTSSGTFDLTPYLNSSPPGSDTQFKVVGISVKDWVYKHKLAMVAFADGQLLYNAGTRECGMGSAFGCGSKVEYRFNVNPSLALFEPLSP
ncbi:hypothetical protein [Deinococcus arenicola]|uniref:Lipoprotein n=1 Tax=Deinococcus arenicola TaxID=2994950 RepID=A0ABU4DUQ8_9DEIO|nr:hypothetical protein [Deinococcus sp. ZS9-10]MDV6376176.1 hypothetical protein [Deinococcus sp. ZS9-10]